MFKRFISGCLAAGLLALAQFAGAAGSSINPNVPAQNSLISSGPLRTNFLAAYNDINALIAQNGGVTAPLLPVLGQQWLNTGTMPYYLEEWDGAQWVILGALNANTHQWVLTPCSASAGGAVPTPPNDPTQLLRGDCTWAAAPVGTVTSASVVSANGFAGSVANSTSTPAITLSTSVNGILQGNGTAISAASTTGTGSVVEATSPVITTPTINGLQYGSTSATVAAAGTTQGSATALTSAYNVVTTVAAGAGVILPVPTAGGASVSIVNKGGNALLVYPNSGAAIDGGAANAAVSLPVGAFYTVQDSSATQWYTFDPVMAGTPNQIAVTNTPGTTTLSIPSNPTLGGANITGVPIGTGVSGLGAGVAAALGTSVGSVGALVVNGGALGTPSSGILTNVTGLPISSGVSGLGTGVATALGNAVSGSGSVCLTTSCSMTTPALGTPSNGTLTNATGLPLTTGVTGVLPSANGGTGVANAGKTITLGGNLTTSGAFSTTLTSTAATSVALPASGSLIASSTALAGAVTGTPSSSTYLRGDGTWSPPSQGILPGYIFGYTLSNDGTTPNTVLDIAAGYAADSTNATMINGTAFAKTISSTWVAGNGNAGMGAGLTVAASTWYHVFAIINGGSFDVYFDTSPAAANKPALTTAFRYIGSFRTNGSSQITKFYQYGQKFMWKVESIDLVNGSATSETSVTLSTPLGLVTFPVVVGSFSNNGGISTGNISPGYDAGLGSSVDLALNVQSASYATSQFQTTTNTSSQIYYNVGSGTLPVLTLYTIGYINPHVAPIF